MRFKKLFFLLFSYYCVLAVRKSMNTPLHISMKQNLFIGDKDIIS